MTCGSPRKIGAAEGEEEEVGSITGPKSSEKSRSGSAGEEKEAAAGVDDGMLRRVSLLASMEWRDIFLPITRGRGGGRRRQHRLLFFGCFPFPPVATVVCVIDFGNWDNQIPKEAGRESSLNSRGRLKRRKDYIGLQQLSPLSEKERSKER